LPFLNRTLLAGVPIPPLEVEIGAEVSTRSASSKFGVPA
jgi:hypothetical protein